MSKAGKTVKGSSSRQSVIATALLILGVLLFTAAVFGIVLVSSSISKKLEASGPLISAVGRQRALTQQISKDLLQLQRESQTHQATSATRDDLIATATTFDTTLGALTGGGFVTDTAGAKLYIPALPSAAEQEMLRNAKATWLPITDAIRSVQGTSVDPRTIAEAVAKGVPENDKLRDQMNDLTGAVEKSTIADQLQLISLRNRLTVFQVLCFVLIVGSLFSRVTLGQRRVQEYADKLEGSLTDLTTNSRELAEAKHGTDLIMDTVSQGLFLIDPKFGIEPTYSKELLKIFAMHDLEGFNFLNIMQRVLTAKMFNTTKDYLDLLFDATKKERTVLKVNPLDEIEVNFPNPDGGFIAKHLSFSFRRIVEDSKISRVFIAVSDITGRVQLERELRESEQRKERQFELLLSILHVEPTMLDDFIATSEEQVRQMNDALRAQDFAHAAAGQMELLRQRLDVVFRCVHNIKGNAALLRLEYFQKAAEQFESKIAEIKNRHTLGGDDFLSIVIAQSELRSDLEELQDLRQKLGGLRSAAAVGASPRVPVMQAPAPAPAPAAPVAAAYEPPVATVQMPIIEVASPDDLVESIRSLASDLSQRMGKEVVVDARGFDTRAMPPERRRIVKDVLIQLTRNSLAHGVETPGVREAAGKPRYATIVIRRSPESAPNSFAFTYRDDGKGIDPAQIRSRAVEQHLISSEDAAGYDDSAVVGLIFAPGFSTKEEADGDAGRGMGMEVIKQSIIDECGGEISLASEPGSFCEFSFSLPLATQPVSA